jgi:hypothetical protein
MLFRLGSPCPRSAEWVFAGALLLLTAGRCLAEPTTVPIPGRSWSVSFDSPAPLQPAEAPVSGAVYFVGSGERFNVSLFVGQPQCNGGTSAYDNYECLRAKVRGIPGIVEQSISRERRGNTVQLSYLVYVASGDSAIKTMHTHILFEREGRWGDLHLSVVRPTVSETARLLGIGDQFKVSE